MILSGVIYCKRSPSGAPILQDRAYCISIETTVLIRQHIYQPMLDTTVGIMRPVVVASRLKCGVDSKQGQTRLPESLHEGSDPQTRAWSSSGHSGGACVTVLLHAQRLQSNIL